MSEDSGRERAGPPSVVGPGGYSQGNSCAEKQSSADVNAKVVESQPTGGRNEPPRVEKRCSTGSPA
ncbi:MAG: hypothetical protein WCJ18_04975 [Planctomycetota bacterium]